jgi:hypothetical protein
MDNWIILWKAVFIGTVSIFSVVAVWVTYQGARDIKFMLDGLRARHKDEGDTPEESS